MITQLFVLHCVTRGHHYIWKRRPVTLDQALQFLLKANPKPNRFHFFEPA